MAVININISGIDSTIRNLSAVTNKLNRELKKSLLEVGLDLKGKSVPLAPLDTGDLRGSCTVTQQGHKVEVGFNTPYAERQHEDMSYNHPQGGQAKYLEQPLNENEDAYVREIIDAVRRSI
jgi:hypothetical protein